MQRRSRGVLLALIAVFAMSAVTAAAASAVKPEFKPVPTKKKFTSTGGVSTWAYGTNIIECTKSSATGEVDGAATVGNVVVSYTGCTGSGSGGSGCPVKTVGAKAEEIVTKPLVGELGTVATSQAVSGVGLLFKPESKTKWFELENDCAFDGVEVFSGKLAVEVPVIGKKQATNDFVFLAASSGGGEKIKEITLDSGVTEKPALEAFGSYVSIANTDEVKFEEPVEIT